MARNGSSLISIPKSQLTLPTSNGRRGATTAKKVHQAASATVTRYPTGAVMAPSLIARSLSAAPATLRMRSVELG